LAPEGSPFDDDWLVGRDQTYPHMRLQKTRTSIGKIAYNLACFSGALSANVMYERLKFGFNWNDHSIVL